VQTDKQFDQDKQHQSNATTRRVILLLAALAGAILFVAILSAQMIYVLSITPPLKLLIMPALVGATAGFTLAWWREKNRILVNQLLEHQIHLNETISSKTLELEEKNKTLEMLSVTDSLTSLANRRLFDITLQQEWGRAIRTKECLSLVMCDVDKFKQYNDCYGHQKGDDCLVRLSAIFKNFTKRGGDLAVRYGGEEFCLILPNTELQHAIYMAETVRKTIEVAKIEHEASDISPFVTASFGVSCSYAIESADDYNQLIVAADKALYKAKKAGRNQVAQ